MKSETFVTHANLLACDCPYCGRRVVAQRPEGFGEATAFAGSVSALVLLYHYTQSISYGRLCELFSGVYGLRISEGAVRNIIKRAEGAFLSQAEKIEKMIRGSPVVCCDETGSRVSGSKSWEWVFVASDCVLHVLRGKRSREVVEEVMGGHRPGVWVSDLYSAQLGNGERQQVCLAHQIRDVRYAIECGDSVFAPKMMELLSEAVEVGRKRDQFCEQELEGKLGSLHGKLDEILALEPQEEEGRKLRRRYMKHRDSLFVFVTNRDVPYTNNVSERAIRMSKTFLKVTNGFRSQWGAQMYAAVRSVINTGKLNGLTALESIVATLEGRSIINPGYSSQHIPS